MTAPARDPRVDRIVEAAIQQHGKGALSRVLQAIEQPKTTHADDPKLAAAPTLLAKLARLPDLATKPWHDPNDVPSLRRALDFIRPLHAAVKSEIEGALAAGIETTFYRHPDLSSEQVENWSSLALFQFGARRAGACARLPLSTRVLDHLEGVVCEAGEVYFSILKPRFHIPPHRDFVNFTFTLHFGIRVPDGCRLRVASETRYWGEGEFLLFDQSFEHEAWNPSDETRICLLADLWHPELNLAERDLISRLTPLLHEQWLAIPTTQSEG